LAIAATGVGAGDMVAAAVSGSRFGFAVAWAAVVGALLKFVLNEGLARWQLATGTTLLEGWVAHLGRWIEYVFITYLVVWSFVVAGALINACGLAAHALAPALSVEAWGAIHAMLAAVLVLVGGYGPFERLIKLFVALMFVTLVGCALFIAPPLQSLAAVVDQATVPRGGARFVLGVIGGVGGSVTLLSYGYWIREKGWEGSRWIPAMRLDLGVAYVLTGLFGLAVVVLAAYALHESQVTIEGRTGVIRMAGMLQPVIGRVGYWTFLVGFWGAVATSMLGVWQGVPYLFCDFVGLIRRLDRQRREEMISSRSWWYRGYLFWLSIPPLVLFALDKPVAVIVAYAVMSALFMPFLAGTLLYLNSQSRWIGRNLRNRWWSVGMLAICLILFGYLGLREVIDLVTCSN
jgi:Mn2+/Fe2+ NRAMP family transporter